jgi:hypothetical protein
VNIGKRVRAVWVSPGARITSVRLLSQKPGRRREARHVARGARVSIGIQEGAERGPWDGVGHW